MTAAADIPLNSRSQRQLRVALFATCINDAFYPEADVAAASLLERLGCQVDLPLEQSCCGQIFTNTGYFKAALATVRSYVQAFSDYDYIVGTSGSCITAVRDQHPMLARWSGDVALEAAVANVASKSYELTEFLIDVLKLEDVGAYFPHTVTFHIACHALRMAKLGDRPQRLLAQVEGLELYPLSDYEQCCGFGGTFALKNAALSAALVAEKAASVESTAAEYLVTLDNACALNIGGRLHRQGSTIQTIHLAEVLASTKTQPWIAGAPTS